MGAKKKKGGKIYYGSDKLFKQAFPGGVKDAIKLIDPAPPHTLVNVDDPDRKRRNRTKTT